MNRTGFGHQLNEKAYTFQLNGNLEIDEQGGIALTNEHSNLLCSRFKPGYKVIGTKFDINSERVYFFLTNPTTKKSEIGFISYFHSLDDNDDLIKNCNCTYEGILTNPLEDTEQIEGCEYITLLSDECNGCLNFDTKYPIKKIEIKGEKYFKTLYWTDNYNPPRFIQLHNLEQYKYKGEEVCGEIICDESLEIESPTQIEDCVTCLDCEKLRIHKQYSIPHIEATSIQFGGNLRRGNYEFLIAYCDRLGNELSEYFSITTPINIFDKNSYILTQPQIADQTNFSIALSVSNLDRRFHFYKVVVVQTTDVNGEVSQYEEGIHPISDTSVLYTTDVGKKTISLQEIFAQKPIFKTWKGLTASNNYLFGYGYTTEKEWNLQPVVSLMGGFVKWQTFQAKQGLYSDGVASSKYKGYMRDEVYPLSIRFGTKDGYWTSLFPFVGRPPTEEETETLLFETNGSLFTSDVNVSSIIDNAPVCATTDRTKRWQYYNTAEFEGFCTSYNLEDFDTIVRTTREVCKVRICEDDVCTDVIDIIPSGTLLIPINTSNFKGLKNWFKDNKDLIYTCCTGNIPCSGIEVEEDCPSTNNSCVNPSWESAFPPELCNLATNNYEELNCSPTLPFEECEECINEDELQANECLPPVLAECSEEVPYPNDIYIKQVLNEQFFLVEKEWENEYKRTDPFGNCTMYIEGTGEGFGQGRLIDSDNRFIWIIEGSDNNLELVYVFKRLSELLYNNSCANSAEVFEKQYSSFPFFFEYKIQQDGYDKLISEEYNSIPHQINQEGNNVAYVGNTAFPVPVTRTFNFYDKLSKNTLWFKINKEDLRFVNEGEEPSIIFEITSSFLQSEFDDEEPRGLYEFFINNNYYRYTIYPDCEGEIIIDSGVVHQDEGMWRMFLESTFEDNNTDTIYIALDCPIVYNSFFNADESSIAPYRDFYTTAPTKGCFNVIKRYKEYKCAEVSHNGIEVSKKQTYEATCKYIIPFLNDCEPSPFSYGKFAYTESTETYPDNKDLYDSSFLYITEEDIPEYIKETFESYYVNGNSEGGAYHLNKETTDLRCKPIRHFKFPDNITQNASFIFNQQTVDANNTIIYPMGVTIDDQIINSFLDIAVKNNLITQEQKNSITTYEIFRGDRTVHKSVLYKGVANDMYRYFDRGKETWFRNFPFNSLGENQYLYENNFRGNFIQHPFGNENNNKFSIIAPEIYYNQPSTATEISIEGYQMGYADGIFREVEEHSKWVILGDKAKDLASTLATLEVAFESAMNIGDAMIGMATSMWSGWTAFSWGFGFAIAGHVIVTVANVVSALLFKYARYKYEWLEIFKNNGTPYNFANRFIGTGNYNFFLSNTEEDSLLRGVVVGKYLKPGTAIITDEKGKSTLRVNNIDRESSYFVSFGQEYPIQYTAKYSNWDNTDEGVSSASRYLSSDSGCDESTSLRRVGSPYMSVKVYSPSQYGAIDSIKWLSTGGLFNLDKNSTEQNTCKRIFGGDTFITQIALKNKYKFFLVDAMKLPNRTPFDYHLYSNIGSSRFYASYETSIIQVEQGRPVPYADTTYVFNCPDEETTYSNDFYVKPVLNKTHKFYLQSFGIANFFVESTINNEYRYAGVEPHEQFYPNVDVIEWTEETKNNFFHNNTFFYNNTYSKNTISNAYRTLPSFYNKKEWDNLFNYPNGVVWSQQDNSEQDLRDPWLVYKPLDKYQFPYDYGLLIDMTGIESMQVFGRFENNALVFNAVDTIADRLTEANWVLGTGGIFATRPSEFSHTELGETGTQHTDIVTTEFGHFWTDAKRGMIWQMMPNGQGLHQISAFKKDGSPIGMRQWFKRHLPFKILKNRKIDGLTEQSTIIDNKYMSLGINMWWDSLFKRLFVTKRDKIVEDPCVKYSDEIGFYIDETECNDVPPIISCPLGYVYNEETEMCEREYTTPPCPSGWEYNSEENTCNKVITSSPLTEEETITTISCPDGYAYNEETNLCETVTVSPLSCPEGYTYNALTDECELEDCYLDLNLVLDTSGSMTEEEYSEMQAFFVNLISEFETEINSGVMRVSIVKFSNCAHYISGGYFTDFNTIIAVINGSQLIGGTNVASGLCEAKKIIDNHARPFAANKTILYTDGVQFLTNSCINCPTTESSGLSKGFEIATQIKEESGSEIIMVISGDEQERTDVKNTYVDPAYPYVNYPPIPSEGSGLYGRQAWEAGFDELATITQNLVDSLSCELSFTPFCEEGCERSDNTCECLLTEQPTTEEETIIHYTCPEGWTLNETTLLCELTMSHQGCEDSCVSADNLCFCIDQIEPTIDTIKTPVEISSFKDVSWTVSYSPIYDSWISYYSFTPDYSIAYNDFFQTGLNNPTDEDEFGVWSHLLTNKSFQVFYGKKYPWTIEIPFKNEYVSKVMEAVNINTSTFRYHNEFDFAERRKQGINKAVLYNTTNNSGYLNLKYSDVADDYKYPIQEDALTQTIKATHHKGSVRFNYFFNRVIDQDNNIPIWNWDSNEIHKTLNNQAISFKSKRTLERIRGEIFYLRLTQDHSSQYKQMYKWGVGKQVNDIF